MPWYIYLAYFFGGAFLVNAIPHFVSGVTGHKFPSPFAKPPGIGLSSPLVNVLWGGFNLFMGYLLVFRGYAPYFPTARQSLVAAAGGFLMAIQLATWFGRANAGNSGGK
jgi:hypothetical protein